MLIGWQRQRSSAPESVCAPQSLDVVPGGGDGCDPGNDAGISGLNHRLPSCSTCHRRLRSTAPAPSLHLAGLHFAPATSRQDRFPGRGAQRTEKIIPVLFIHPSKWFLVQIVEHRLVPCQRLFAWKMTFNHRRTRGRLTSARAASLLPPIASSLCDNVLYRLSLRYRSYYSATRAAMVALKRSNTVR